MSRILSLHSNFYFLFFLRVLTTAIRRTEGVRLPKRIGRNTLHSRQVRASIAFRRARRRGSTRQEFLSAGAPRAPENRFRNPTRGPSRSRRQAHRPARLSP